MNAGFFLFLFLILFAILPGPDTIRLHRGLMEAATGSWAFAGIAAVVFLLYNFKCISFTIKELNLPENNFLFNLQALSDDKQWLLYLQCHAGCYFPLFLYGTVTAFVGYSGHQYLIGTCILIWQVLMCIAGAYVYFTRINSTWKRPVLTLPSFTLVRQKSFLFYLLHFSLENKKGTFIAIKIFSLLLLQFLVILNDGKASKENVCFLVLFCISAHALLPVYYVRFTETDLGFLRNLPLSLGKRLLAFVLTYAIIFIPEILFLLWNERNVMPVQLTLSVYILAVSRLTLYTSMQYINNMTIDRFTSIVLGMFFVSLVLLASLNLWVFITIETVVAVALFFRLYYRYEGVLKGAE